MRCIFKTADEPSFNLTRSSDIAIDSIRLLSTGLVTCTTSHLTQFALAYKVPFP